MNVAHEIDLLVEEIQRLGSKSKFVSLFWRIFLHFIQQSLMVLAFAGIDYAAV